MPHLPCRDNPAALGEAKAHAGAKLVPVLKGQSLITQQNRPRAVVLELQKASEHIDTENLVFLGLQDGGTPVFSAPCQDSITDLAQAAEIGVNSVPSVLSSNHIEPMFAISWEHFSCCERLSHISHYFVAEVLESAFLRPS